MHYPMPHGGCAKPAPRLHPQTPATNSVTRRRLTYLGLAGIGIAFAALSAIKLPPDGGALVLLNDSASVPEGLWLRESRGAEAAAKVAAGDVIAFRPPARALPYVRAYMPEYLHKQSILKYVVATDGDTICRQGTRFSVDHRYLGTAMTEDGNGHALPTWSGCTVLRHGQVAVFSDRIPNSFDSRYYGPIPSNKILGLYRPLLTW